MIGDLFNLLLLQPTINLVAVILQFYQGLHVPGALGFSIITLTVLINLLVWPLRSRQIRTTRHTQTKMAELKPKIDELKVQHKDDKMAFNQAQAALLKEHGVNPAAGCLPSLIPVLIIFPLYQVIFAFFSGATGLYRINYFLYNKAMHLSSLPDTHFFLVNLSTKPSDFAKVGPLILLIPVLTAGMQFVLSRMMMVQPVKPYPSDSNKEKNEKASQQDQMAQMQSQMMVMMPIMIGVFAFQFPIGLALYWNTLTILGMIQQYRISGWGNAAALLGKKPEAVKVISAPKSKVKSSKDTKVTIDRS